MAIDTVRLESDSISEELAQHIEGLSMQRIGFDRKTDTMLYCITSADLKGSYDNRIMVQIKRERIVSSKSYVSENKATHSKVVTAKELCEPYIVVEASCHKIFLGHNIKGGLENFSDACNYLIYIIEKILEIKLPIADNWLVTRIDWAYVFDLKYIEAVQEFFYLMKNSTYPRLGAPDFYGNHGLSIGSTTTSSKMYNKGVEFKVHDFKKLKVNGIFSTEKLFEMMQEANSYLRVEIGIHIKKLKYDFERGVEDDNGNIIRRYGKAPCVKHITTTYLKKAYETQIYRLMNEGREENTKTKNSMEIQRRLKMDWNPRVANILFSAWLNISQFGLDFHKQNRTKTQYHDDLKKLRKSGISINLTDSKDFTEINGKTHSLIPDDFQPIENDSRRIVGVDEKIINEINKMKSEKLSVMDERIRKIESELA